MAITKQQALAASVAFQRLGLGAKPGGLAAIAADPVEALIGEIEAPKAALLASAALPSYADACAAGVVATYDVNAILSAEADARMAKHLEPTVGFVERLVLFWANHFAMSFKKTRIVRATIGHFEREVIRKNVLGNFSDMFLAALKHPAMISFLDNDMSIDRISEVGIKTARNYTENLAREMMELHSLGTGNYKEADVKALANMLTGWSITTNREADNFLENGTPQTRGQFVFKDRWHYDLQRKFLGQNIPAGGVEQGERAIAILASHPATARHIAFKLARHFIADEPTAEMIDPLAEAFLDTGGDLAAVAAALARLEIAWTAPQAKLRTPYEFMIATYRALGTRLNAEEMTIQNRILNTLGQPIWDCPSPEGFPDDSRYWLSAQGVAFRIDAAQSLARTIGRRVTVDGVLLARKLYGKAMSAPTQERVAAGGSQLAALTILFASPEFQRR